MSEYSDLPTPRTTLASSYVRVLIFCRSCRHQAFADLQGLIDAGRGDEPLIHLRFRFRCGECRSARVDFVCTSDPRPRSSPPRSSRTPPEAL